MVALILLYTSVNSLYLVCYVFFRSHPEHYEKRIGRDMRHLAVSVAASIDKPWQWKLFFDEGGGVLPLLECIRDGARSVQKGKEDFEDGDVDGTSILMEQHEASFAAACTACRALRDLSALSKDFSAVVTDDILKVISYSRGVTTYLFSTSYFLIAFHRSMINGLHVSLRGEAMIVQVVV